MHLIRGLQRWQNTEGCVATIGNFDGVHLGHQAIFKTLKEHAEQQQLPSTVISFAPLPIEFFSPDTAPGRLHGLRNRVQAMRQQRIDRLLLLKFDDAFAKQSAAHFIQHTLVDVLKIKHLIVGDDFRFGRDRGGDFQSLQEAGERFGFSVAQSPTVLLENERVSSTRVRHHLNAGELTEAQALLGQPYRISGRVIHGEKVGRQLGFPTANVALHRHRPPLRGVFAVVATDAETGKAYGAVANLGERPTVGGRKLLLEVHMLDCEAELYGHHLHIDFLQNLRGEVKFDSLDALKAAIANDADNARHILNDTANLTKLANRIH